MSQQMEELIAVAKKAGCEVRQEEPMSRHTTFRIGGPAEVFVVVPGEEALQKLLVCSKKLEIPVLVVGNGSNMLVSDHGIDGLVIALGEGFKKVRRTEKGIIAGAAASVLSACSFAQKESLTGMEFLWGIPGSIGGAVYMNAGAYGGEIGQLVDTCGHTSLNGTLGTFTKEKLAFSYRHSAYQEQGDVILWTELVLQPGNPEEIRRMMEDYYSRRKAKQPLEYPSAGSVFKRPQGHFAGALIEQCGLKGCRVGGAMVSEKHAGFIVNSGGATCNDVLKLIELIQERVFAQTGVRLECEVKRLGR